MADNTMKLGLILSATDHMSRVIDMAVGKSADKLKKFNKTVESVNKFSNKMLISGGVMAAGIYQTVLAAEDGIASEKRLANVFKTMWGNNGAANKAGKAASDYAEKLALQIGVEDDIIRIAQAKLATFSNVSNKVGMTSGVFDRATKAAHDMAAVGFGEASQNAVILGKALDSPMTMIKALRKQGTVNDNDIINIQNIYKTKGLLAAQKAILEAVERQVKGTGIATAKATDIMKVGFSKISEAIGGAFLPSIEEAQRGAIGFLEPILNWINNNHKLIRTIAKIAIGLVALAVVMRIATFTIKMIRGAMIAWNAIIGINAFFMKAMPLTMATNVTALKSYAVMQKIATAAQWLWNAALYANPIVWIIAAIAALVVGIILLIVHWDKVKKAMDKWSNSAVYQVLSVMNPILKVIELISFMQDRWGGITKAFKSKGLLAGILAIGKAVFSFILKPLQVLLMALSKIPGMGWAKKQSIAIGGFRDGLDSGSKIMKQIHSNSQSSSVSTVSNKSSSSAPVSVNYAPVINMNGGSVADKESFRKMLNDHKFELSQTMSEINRNNKRLSFAH